MVLCLIVACGEKTGRKSSEKQGKDQNGLTFFRVPAIITHQGEQTELLSTERRRKWIAAISREDLTDKKLANDRVCGHHFVSGAAAKDWDKHNVDWVPTLNLGHSKQPGLTAKEIFNSGFDEESKDLPSSGVDDPINNDIEEPGMSDKATDTNEFDFLTANTPKEKLLDESYFKGDDSKGSISFEAWGRRTSDKYLTDNCGILKLLKPGDLVLADRGFTIEESVGLYQAKLAIPAFTKGKDQLDPVDVEKTRGIANVRNHVERVIGLLRQKYTMLQGTLPIDYLTTSKGNTCPTIDRIIRVCASLTNLCPSVIPFD
eukprot:gene2436-18090_t